MPIHIAITRRVQPGREGEFQQALREFFRESFAHGGVLGATMLVPPPGSNSREFGILRTFADEKERDDFYASPAFKAWEERIKPLTDGGWSYRQLSGLEAWFRSPGGPPPRWKMALLTWVGVCLMVLVVSRLVRLVGAEWPWWAGFLVTNTLVVIALTWLVMPVLTRIARPWLSQTKR